MPVTNNFSSSELDIGNTNISAPTALVWGPDGRLFITEVSGNVNVLTTAFGDKDGDGKNEFHVTDSVTVGAVKAIPNHDDDGSDSGNNNRQVTGIDVTRQFDDDGNQLYLDDQGELTTQATGNTAAVTMYVTSSDSRIGAGGGGGDSGLDTNSGVITKLTQTGPDSWDAVDLVRGLARSEENHALNGLEVIQEIDGDGKLVSERLIAGNGGDTNTGAPSNNFAGQQETAYSAAILEVDLEALKAMTVQTDSASGRSYVYDIPTLDDPTRAGDPDGNDPFGGNDGLNGGKLAPDGPVTIYSPGYRNPFDVEVTEDGRVWTYDNGANNSWGGRPVGEAGSSVSTDFAQDPDYIATNLNNGDGSGKDDINLENWNPSNDDNFHEVTRSDDLDGRTISNADNVTTYTEDGLTYFYGGHPNPTRAEGSRAGLLFSPGAGTDDAFLLVSDTDSYGNGGGSDYAEVIAWLEDVEAASTEDGIYGAGDGDLTKKVIAATPGVAYDIYKQPDGSAEIVETGQPSPGGTLLGTSGLPADIAEIVDTPRPLQGDYLEAGEHDGALDTGRGSINGLAEYTSTVLDDSASGTRMSGAIIASIYNSGDLIIMGREADGTLSSTNGKADDRTTITRGGQGLGVATIGDDTAERGLNQAYKGSIWLATFNQGKPKIQIFQPDNGAVPLAGAEITDPTDNDLDGVDHIADPFEYSAENGYALAADSTLDLSFDQVNATFIGSYTNSGLLGAALDGTTPNRDADPAQNKAGLYDQANQIPGANAPYFQVKDVVDGTVVGAANTARDVMQTGFRAAPDVGRVAVTMTIDNWIPQLGTAPAEGQLTGLLFGDGTQSNFLRVVFGGTDASGTPKLEVGYELGDADYTVLGTADLPALADTDDVTGDIELRLDIDIDAGFAVGVAYRLEGQSDFTEVALDGGAGFELPAGVLREVLTGGHQISDGDSTLPSGAAVGLLTEDSAGGELKAVNFNDLEIRAFGNEIAATTGAEVGQAGTAGSDTIVYTGTDTDLAALDPSVENFDGSGSAADYAITGNSSDNILTLGAGQNVVITGGGADSVRGTLSDLAGDEITDFSEDDEVVIAGESTDGLNVTYAAGSAEVTVNGATITFSGPDFADFDPAKGDSVFDFEDTDDGLRLTRVPEERLVQAINAGTSSETFTIDGAQVTFEADEGGPAAGFVTKGPGGDGGSKIYSGKEAEVQGADYGPGALDALHYDERSSAEDHYGYEIPVVENGTYRVDLYAAEIYHGVSTGSFEAGDRVFDILVEGQTVADDLDLFDVTGAPLTEAKLSYTAEVTDGAFTLDFDSRPAVGGIDQPKISGLALYQLGAGTAPADTTAPVISDISVANPASVQDGPRFATVVLNDETGFDASDFAGLDGSELTFSGIVPDTVSAPQVTLGDGATTATLEYTLSRDDNSWPAGEGAVSVAAGAYGDAAGNPTAAKSGAFILSPNLANLVAGELALAINVGPETNGTADLDGADDTTYGGAIQNDPILGIDLEADDAAYYSPSSKTGNNIDGIAGSTGSNPDLDGSALHTYRDSANGSFTATYPIENGTYVVELHFAELYWNAAGKRQGDYTINGETFATDFDAFTEAGGPDTPVTITRNVAVTDGRIVIDVNDDTGQPGFNAIAVYEAVDANLPPTISVGDVSAAEGGEATLTFTRVGDDSQDVTVDFSLSPDSATAADYGAPVPAGRVTIAAGESTATATVPIIDDDTEEPAESFTVTIDGVANAAGDAVTGTATATVTIAASDSDLQVPAGGEVFGLDFETAGAPQQEGGFDGLLGGAGALEAGKATVTGGKLVVDTSNGDLSQGPATASKNDFTKAADISGLDDAYLTTRFDNPFPAALAAQGEPAGTVPPYAQQGIVVATGDTATNQDADHFVKLIFGGGGDGTVVQMWSQDDIDQVVALDEISTAAGAGFGLDDIASVELSLAIDRPAGEIGQWVTFFDASGAVLGGVRPTATPGFATAPALPIPDELAAAISDGSSVAGVTSTDYNTAFDSFPATWDFLSLTSPQATGAPAAVTAAITGDGSVAEGASASYDVTLSGDPAATTEVVVDIAGGAVDPASLPQDAAFSNGGTQITLTFEPGAALTQSVTVTAADDTAPEPAESFEVAISGIGVTPGGAGSVATSIAASDGPVVLSIAAADPVVEAAGATLDFALTASDGFAGDLVVAFDTADQPGQTQTVSFTGGAGTLSLPVVDDDTDDGDDTVAVTLTGATDPAATDPRTVTIDTGAATASGTVTEDDGMDPTLAKGDFVFGVNVGGDAVTTTDGTAYEADTGAAWTGTTAYSDGDGGKDTALASGDYDRDGDTDADDTLYATDRYGDPATFTRDGLTPGDYVLTLKFAENYDPTFADNARAFSVTANGTEVVTDLDLFDEVAEADQAHDIDVPVTVGSNGRLELVFDASADNAKVNALALYETEGAPAAAAVSVADVTVDEEAGTATLTFTRTGADDEAVSIAYSTADGTATAGEDYTAASGTVDIPAGGAGTASVDIALAGDTLDEGDETFTVTIDSATAATNTVTIDDAEATVTLSDDDAALPPMGTAPDADLDQDGTINSADTDIDGDGALNGEETFSYDATDAGRALVAGENVRFEFDTAGTPFQNGFTGALLSPNDQAPEIDLANAGVAGGTLTVTATPGDHYGDTNAQQNAFVAAYTAPEGLSVETRFAIPDYNSAAAGDQASVDYQASGVVIGTDQNNMVKAVYGRGNAEFELAQDNVGSGATATSTGGGTTPAGAAEVAIRLELFFEEGSGAAQARAFYTFYDDTGAALGTADTGIGPIDLSDEAGAGNSLKSMAEGGAPLGAGVIQTATNGSGSGPEFEVSYQYLDVTALGTPPANAAPTVDAAIADQTTDEDAAFSFAVPADAFADDAGAENLTLTAAMPDGSALPGWLSFDGTSFSGTPADADVGTLAVRVTATDEGGESVFQDFTLEVADTNDAPTAVTLSPATLSLAEDTDTTAGTTKLADIVVSDDGLGSNDLALTGADAGLFAIVPGMAGPELHLAQGAALDFETAQSLDVAVTVDDPGVGTGPDATAAFTLAVTDANDAPTIAGTVADAATTVGTAATVDLSGLTLADEDAGDTPALAARLANGDPLPAGITLDGTTLDVADTVAEGAYEVAAFANDGQADSESAVNFTVTVGAPVNQAPTVALANAVSALPEDADLTGGRKVADIVVSDDGLGNNELALTGADAGSFGIAAGTNGPELILKAGAALDFETAQSLDVAVTVDDPGIGTDPDATAAFTLAVTDANDAPTIAGTVADAATTVGTAATVDLSGLTLADEDAGDTPALAARLANGDPLPAGITLDGTTLDVAGTVAEGAYEVAAFANDGQADSDSAVNFTVTVGADEPAPTGTAIDFSGLAIASYGTEGGQDADAAPDSATVSDGGDTLTLSGNTWKSVPLPAGLTIAADTVLRFDLTVAQAGEIQGIGLDSDASWKDQGGVIFQLAGADPLSAVKSQAEIVDLRGDYDTAGGQTVEVAIPLGAYAGQGFSRLTFVNDEDVAEPSAEAAYSNIVFGGAEPGNADPVADDEAFTATTGTPLEIDVATLLDGDTDADGDTLTVTGVSNAQNGTAVLSGGTVTFTPDTGFTGAAGFDYTVTDGKGGSTTGAVAVTVGDAPNTGPVVAETLTAQSVAEDATGFGYDVSAGFDDDAGAENLTLTATLAGGGALPGWLSFDGAAFSGTPEDGDVGAVSVQVTATDQEGATASQAFDLTVTNTNDAPTVAPAEAPGDQDATAGQGFALTLSEALFDDADLDSGDALTLSAAGLPDGVSFDPATGSFSGTPAAAGTSTVTVTATDTAGATAQTGFDITVAEAPVAGTPIDFGEGLSSYGTVTGQDKAAPDGASVSADGTEVTLSGNTWKKIALPDGLTIESDTVLRFSLALPAEGEVHAIGLDKDGAWKNDNGVLFQLAGSQTLGAAVQDYNGEHSGGTVDYEIPLGAYAGQDFAFLTLVNDEDVAAPSAEAVFSGVTFTSPAPENQPPVATPVDAGTVAESGAAVTIDLLDGASDGDGGTLGVSGVSVADIDGTPVAYTLDGAVLTVDPGQFADALDAGESATVAVDYTVTDGQGGETANTATLEVTGEDAAAIWYEDFDGDGFGDPEVTQEAVDQPAGYVDNALDQDDTDDTVYPGAPELADGKDNDQDGEIDEGVTPEAVTPVAFTAGAIESYDIQDTRPGSGFAIGDGGDALTLDGNVWKKTALPDYEFTEDTVLRFDFTSAAEGEIQAIGLETDNDWKSDGDAIFQLFGTQNFAGGASQAYNTYEAGQGTQHYEIDLGDYAGSDFSALVFLNDDDDGAGATGTFSNVALVEPGTGGDGGTGQAPVIFGGTIPDATVDEESYVEMALPFTDAETPTSELDYGFTGLPGWLSETGGVLTGTAPTDFTGDLQIGVTATDPEGNSASGDFTLTVENVNDTPELAGTAPDREITIGRDITFALPEGLFTDVDAGDTLSYSADLPDGLSIDAASGTISGTATAAGTFAATITATDAAGASAEADFTFEVRSGPPRETVRIEAEDFTAFDEPGQTADFSREFAAPASGNQQIRLDTGESGTISTALDGAGVVEGFYDLTIRYMDEDDGAATLRALIDRGDGSAPELLETLTFDRTDLPGQGAFLEAGNLTEVTISGVEVTEGARLILEGVADAQEVVRVDYVQFAPVEAPTNAAPVFDSAETVTVAENDTAAATVAATDPEGGTVDYTIAGGADGDLFAIDAGGNLSFKAAPDFEAPGDADGNGVYEVTVAASDGEASTEQTIAVTVADTNEAPGVTLTPVLTEIAEDADTTSSTKLADIAVTDDALGTNTLSLQGADAGSFEIVNGTELHLAAGATLDFETAESLDVTVAVDDAALGAGAEATAPFTLAVTDVEDGDGGTTPPEPLLRINAYGGEVAATDGGPAWSGDGNGAPNSPYLATTDDRGDTFGYSGDAAAIPADLPAAVLDTARSSDDPFSYDIPVSALAGNGDYTVNLYLAELFSGNSTPGDRVFDVEIEGQLPAALDNIDVAADGSAFDAEILSYDVTVTDGALNIDFLQDAVDGSDNPIVNAIEIVGGGDTGGGDPGDGDGGTGGDPGATDAAAALDGDLDGDGTLNQADSDIDGDGTANGADRAAYDATDAGTPLAEAGEIALDFAAMADGTSPFAAGFTGAAQTADGTAELDYATNDGARVTGGRLTFDTTDADTNDGKNAFTFLSEVGDDFTFEGTFDNPVFGDTAGLQTFSQYGLIISMTGAPGADTGADGDFFKLVTGNPGGGFEISGRGSFDGNDVKIPYPDGVGATDFAQVKLSAEVDSGTGTLTGRYELLDDAGATLAEGLVGTKTPAAGSAIHDALTGAPGAAVPAFGVTSTDFGDGAAFGVGVESLRLVDGSGGSGGDLVDPPADPDDAQAILAGLTDIDAGASYGGGAVGSAELSVTAGGGNVRDSNYGNNSFELTNTGDKEIAAVFLDFRNALYGDSVVDFDGSAGDTVAQKFNLGSTGSTGAFFDSDTGDTYYLPGDDPLANDTGTGAASSGGWKGLLLKSSGGFGSGESVAFGGDMDPNSIAGLSKGGGNGVDNGAVSGWDVGGVSGAELIGSAFTVQFDDGTTATGILGSDGSQAGSAGSAVQGRAASEPSVTVDGATSSGTGTYGGAVPEIVVAGAAGATVRVVLTRGLNPVTNDSAGIAQLVDDRLDAGQSAFPVSNAADFQTYDAVIGQDGTVTLPEGAFDWTDPASGEDFAGSAYTDGFDTAPAAVAVAAIDGDGTPLGAVDRVYLANDGGPVVPGSDGGDGGDGGGTPGNETDGYYEIIGSGNSARFKVQIEDADANGGTAPAGDWTFVAGAEDGKQGGFQGAGYYRYGDGDSEAITQNVDQNEVLEYQLYIPEGETGEYAFRARVSRDGDAASDQQNDLWLNFEASDGSGGGIESYLASGSDEAEPTSGEFVKLYGGPNDGSWGYAENVDGVPGNFGADLQIDEAGLYTVEIAGRSDGFHIDSFDFYKGGAPGASAPDSAFVEGAPGNGGGGSDTPGTITRAIAASSDDTDQDSGGGAVNLSKPDLELGDSGRDVGLRFTGLDLSGLDGVGITEAYIEFTGRPSGGSSGTIDATIAMQDSLSPATFASGSGPVDRDQFDFTTDWTDADVPGANETFRTADISDMLEAFFDDNAGALGSSDDLAFIIEDEAGVRKAQSFDGGIAPELVIVHDGLSDLG